MSRWRTVWLMLMFAVMGVRPTSAQPNPADTLLAEVGRGQIHSVVWHPGGDHFYVNTVRGAMGAWRYDAATLDGQPMGLASVWLAPGGRWLMATDDAGVWHVLALDDERLIRGDLHNLTFSPDGRWATAATGADQPIELLDGETLETVGVLPDESGDGMRWKPDGKGWFTPAEAGTVQVWWVGADGDIQAGERLGEPGEEMRWVWHPSDDRLMQYNPQGAATVYDAQTGEVVDTLQATEYESDPEFTWFIAWTPNGRAYELYHHHNTAGAGFLTHVDIETREALRTFFLEQSAVEYTPDLQRIVDTFAVYDANTYEVLHNHDGSLNRLAVSPDGKKVFSTGYVSEVLQVYDLETGKLVFEHDRYPDRSYSDYPYGQYRGWWSPDSTRLLAQDATNGLWLYDATTGQQLRHQGGHVGYTYNRLVEYSQDSSTVAIIDQLHTVYLYDTQTGALLTGLNDRSRAHVDPIEQIEWHPDADYLAIRTHHPTSASYGLEQRKVFVWSSEGQLVYVIENPARANGILWASDGSYLLTTSDRHLTRWYTSRERQPRLQTWDDGFGTFASPSFSPDNRFVVIDSNTGSHGSSGLIVRDAQTLERLSNQMDITYRRWSWTADSRQLRSVGTRCETYYPPSDCQIVLYVGFDADVPVQVAQTPYPVQIYPEPTYTFGAYEDEPILLWSPDGSKVAVLADEYVDVWAVGGEQAELMDTYLLGESDRFQWGEDSTPQMIRTRDTGTFRSVFSPDGRTYITTEGGVLRMYRVGASD